MGIWRVLKGTILCDKCGQLLAYIEFDAKDEPTVEHVRTLCIECYEDSESKPTGEKYMREIKFRFWSKHLQRFVVPDDDIFIGALKDPDMNPMQYTGLKDKNGDKEIYEDDIVGADGNVIGNLYETPALLERETNLLIQGFGTKNWLTTYSEAVERGCHDA